MPGNILIPQVGREMETICINNPHNVYAMLINVKVTKTQLDTYHAKGK
jgi:hypothetical protein